MSRPDAISRADILKALEGLGLDVQGDRLVRRVVFDIEHVELTYEALGDDGQPVFNDDALAEVTYRIPIKSTSDDEPMRA